MSSVPQIFDPGVASERIEMLHESGLHVSLATTGAGLGIQGKLWEVPGASATLVDAISPYSQTSFDRFVGYDWAGDGHGYASELGATALAQKAFFNAQEHGTNPKLNNLRVAGLGLSAAVSTNRDRRGENKVHASIRSNDGIATAFVLLNKDLGRANDGAIADIIGINLILSAAGIDPIPLYANSGIESEQLVETPEGLILLPAQHTGPDIEPGFGTVMIGIDGEVEEVEPDPDEHIIMPGSFNPIQFGHDSIAQAARTLTGKKPILEITARNIEKDGLSLDEIVDRAAKLKGRWPVILTESNTRFTDKTEAYNGCDFIVGYDTARRIVDPAYYDSPEALRNALDGFREANVRFYVAGRRDGEGILRTAADIGVDDEHSGLFVHLGGDFNISSTMVREHNGR
jgi:hypothetical protein